MKNVITETPISMSWGYPDLKNISNSEIKRIFDKVSRKELSSFLQYDPSLGNKELRKYIVENKMGDFGKISIDDLLITPGGAYSIFLSAFYLKNVLKIKTIGVFYPSYDTALEIFKRVGLKIVDAEKHLNKAQSIYIMTRFANPSGYTLNKREYTELCDKIVKKNMIVLEDDVYHTLNYTDTKTYCFKQKLSDRVIYIDSFSKLLAPGLRLAYLVPPKNMVTDMAEIQKYFCNSASMLSQIVALEMLKARKYSAIALRNRLHYQKKMYKLIDELKKNGLEGYFKVPLGGFYVWLKVDLPLDNARQRELILNQVNVVGGGIYFDKQYKENYVRLSIANIDIKDIPKAVRAIKEVFYV